MILNEKNGVAYYTFPNLANHPSIVHGIFTKKGGNSTGPFSGLNISFGLDDDKENVLRNRNIISNIFYNKDIVSAIQAHGKVVNIVEKGHDLIPGENSKDPRWARGPQDGRVGRCIAWIRIRPRS